MIDHPPDLAAPANAAARSASTRQGPSVPALDVVTHERNDHVQRP